MFTLDQLAAIRDAAGLYTFAWKQGPRGGRYWLPDGQPDAAPNRLYGKAAERAAAAAGEEHPRGNTGRVLGTIGAAGIGAALGTALAGPLGGLAGAALGGMIASPDADTPKTPAGKKLRKATPKKVQVGDPAKPTAVQNPVLRPGDKAGGSRPRPRPATTAPAAATTTPAALPAAVTSADDVKALRKAVDDGVVSNRRTGWNYDFEAARKALAEADKKIDDFARRKPRKVAALAREVTKVEPASTEHGVRLLKAWVGETLEILRGMPGKPRLDPLGNLPKMSDRQFHFAELRSRAAAFHYLLSVI